MRLYFAYANTPYEFVFGAGWKLVETGKPGARPEKPIELYEFEGYSF